MKAQSSCYKVVQFILPKDEKCRGYNGLNSSQCGEKLKCLMGLYQEAIQQIKVKLHLAS